MIVTLSFFIENIFNRLIVLLAQWYTNLLSPDGDHPNISLSLRLLVVCLVCTDLFVIHYCLQFFFKELISFIGSLTIGSQTSVLIYFCCLVELSLIVKCLVKDQSIDQHSWIDIPANKTHLQEKMINYQD